MLHHRKHIGLLFGSFNPIHIGHLILANYMRETQQMDEVWLVVSPQNPFKESDSLIDSNLRLQMVELALTSHPGYQACNIELTMPTPSYTIHTLNKLSLLYPDICFSIIMGADNLQHIDQWKSSTEIINNHQLFIYPRLNYPIPHSPRHQNIVLTNAPIIEISSTFIRQCIHEGKDVRFLLPHEVYQFIKQHQLYR